jgi:hypothetical protein
VQRSADAVFSSAVQVYSGPSTSYAATNRPIGRDYYRVRGTTNGDHCLVRSAIHRCALELEPNNTPAQANGPIQVGITYYGVMPDANPDPDSAAARDYFYIDLTTSSKVEIWLTHIVDGQDYNLVLRRNDATYSQVAYSGGTGNVDEHFVTDSKLSAGRYYVQIFKYSGGSTASPYQVRYVLR